VGYVQLPQGVAYIVLTSPRSSELPERFRSLEKVLKTLVYVEPKSEVASGQEYAHRYRQLLDQHAEAQIEPLLTEWREKAPDDPTHGSRARIIILTNARRTSRRRNPAQATLR
jgi:hypothetical protein